MALTKEEMETVVLFNRAEDGMCISTSDRTVMTKLDKLCSSSNRIIGWTDSVELESWHQWLFLQTYCSLLQK